MNHLDPNHLFKLISSAYPGLITYLDRNCCYRFVNEEYQKWFDISAEKVVGKTVADIIGEENFLARKSFMDRALKGEKVKFISVIYHKTLGHRQLEQIYHPDVTTDGTVVGFMALANDITEKRKAERAAQENEARFRSLTEVMPQLVWVADGGGKITWFNENWARVTGTKLKDNLGDGWLQLLHPEDRISTVLNLRDTIHEGVSKEAEYRIRMTDGSYRWHVARAISIRDENGKIVRWVGTATDIEEQKNAKEIADRERKRIYSIFMQSPVVITVTSGPDHIFELVNPVAQEYFGKRKIQGQPAREALPELEDQGFFQMLDEIYFNGVGKAFTSFPVQIKQDDGSTFEHFYDLFYEPIKDENGLTTGILSMFVDVTEQVKALITRDQFLSIASHELKTPLTSLKLQSQITLRALKMNKEISQERQVAMANQTSELVGRLTRLIDDMLDVSRIKTGKLKLDKNEHELGDIVREVVFRMSVLFEAAGLNIPTIEAQKSLMGEWDRFRLEQVVGNLLTNAIRYGMGRPVEIKIEKENSNALLSVADQGYGIAEEDLHRIFGRFERAINSSEVSGLGLGLFISKEIVESHGGNIWVESEVGKGSTFFVSLPVKSEK